MLKILRNKDLIIRYEIFFQASNPSHHKGRQQDCLWSCSTKQMHMISTLQEIVSKLVDKYNITWRNSAFLIDV